MKYVEMRWAIHIDLITSNGYTNKYDKGWGKGEKYELHEQSPQTTIPSLAHTNLISFTCFHTNNGSVLVWSTE